MEGSTDFSSANKFVLNEQNLQKCKISDKQWKCPISACSKVLSRKQTLTSHLVVVHDVDNFIPSKRYKMYETDINQDIPRTTVWRKQGQGSTTEEVSVQQDEYSITQNIDPSVDSSADNEACTVDMDVDDDLINEPIEIGCTENVNKSETEQGSQKCKNAPLYVIKCDSCSDCIYKSQLSKAEHELAVLAYAARHCLSDTALEDLLQLLKLYLPESNLLDGNIAFLKERCGFNKEFLKTFTFCNICKNTVDKETESCTTPNCPGKTPSSKNKSFFMTGDLKIQLKDILAKPGVWESILAYRKSEATSITDITDGAAYKELTKEGNFLHSDENISLTLFTDGVPLFKSSGVSMWPVYLLVNEIPRNQRFRKKNMLLWGVWQGVGKPSMTVFLSELVKDINDLYINGIKLTLNDKDILCRAMLAVATMDLQARAAVLKMTQHNGKHACVYCLQEGKQVPSGKGHCKAFPYSAGLTLRTSEQIREHSKSAQTGKSQVYGFQGESVLLYLQNFELNVNIVIDYMHGFLLGVTKKLLNLWFDIKHTGKPFNISKNVKDVDRKLTQVTPPHRINRLPRSIATHLNNWKASELRAWLLFYSLPCLTGSLDAIRLKHFSLFVEAAYILLTEGITVPDLQRAELLLNKFVKHASELYGDFVMGLNMHNMLHITDCVKLWGPLWAWSCFSFESFNGEIKKTVHGTGNVCLQIFWALLAQKHIEQNLTHVDNSALAAFVKSQSDTVSSGTGVPVADPCLVKKTYKMPSTFKLTEGIKQQLEEMTGHSDISLYKMAKKVIVNGFVVYSKSCTKVKKRNSYTVMISGSTDNMKLFEVDLFVVDNETSNVFAVGRCLRQTGNCMQQNAPHLIRVEYESEDKTVAGAKYIQGVLVSFRIDGQHFIAELPNSVEGD